MISKYVNTAQDFFVTGISAAGDVLLYQRC